MLTRLIIKKKTIEGRCPKKKELYHPKSFETAAMSFLKEVQWGPSFCCVSFQREMFKREVKSVTQSYLKKLEECGFLYSLH